MLNLCDQLNCNNLCVRVCVSVFLYDWCIPRTEKHWRRSYALMLSRTRVLYNQLYVSVSHFSVLALFCWIVNQECLFLLYCEVYYVSMASEMWSNWSFECLEFSLAFHLPPLPMFWAQTPSFVLQIWIISSKKCSIMLFVVLCFTSDL